MKITKKVLSVLLSLMLVLGWVAVGGMSALADGESVANYGTPRGSYICQYRLGDTYGDHWSGSYILIEYLNYTLKLGRVNPNPDPSTMHPYEPTDPDSMEKGYILFPAMCDDPAGYDINIYWVNGGYATDDEVVFDLSFPDGSNLHVEEPVPGGLGSYHVETTPGESADYEVFKVAAIDSMLDGWTGGAIEIYQEGSSEPFTRVVNNDGEARTENDILLPSGYSYRFDWVYDRNNSECSVEVTDNNGLTYSAVDPINGPLWFFDVTYKIGDAANLRAFADNVNNRNRVGQNVTLTADIDLGDEPFTPIGNQNVFFEGTFDGDGHKITGLTTPGNYGSYAGLFGFVGEGGIVRNVGLEDGKITGNGSVGGVAGVNSGTVTNCYNTGDVSGTGYGVGGVVGLNYGTATNCYNTGSVSGTGNNVGGVVGFISNNAEVKNCYNTGSVSGTEDVGGVVGYNPEGTVTNCYNTGGVSGSENVGGVIGFITNNAEVKNCYNTGGVSGSENVGGVIGYNPRATVTNCYNTGSVSGSSYVGGVVGYNPGGTVTNCYNTGDVSGTGDKVGGVVGFIAAAGTASNCYYDSDRCTASDALGSGSGTNVTGLTTAQMTGANALENMVFEYGDGEENPWLTKADGADENGGYYWFYPHLKGFAYDLTAASEDWPAKVEITVASSDGNSCTYDGDKHGVYVTVGDSSAPEGATVTYFQYNYSAEDNKWEWDEISDSPTNPGKYKMEIRSGEDTVTKYFTILEQATDYTVSYYKKTGDGWSSEFVDPVDAGEYKAVVTFTDTGHAPLEKEFKIVPKAVAVTACGPDGPTKAYNGQEQVHTDSVIWIYDREETGLDDSKLRYTGNTTVTGTDAGRHSVDLSAEYCFCDDSNYDVTFTAEGDFDFDIAQSVLTITADDLETNYGEDIAGLTYKIEPRFGSYYNIDELGITLSTDADKNKAGTYDITVTIPDNPNYLITTQKGTYTVSQIDPGATVTAEDIDYGQKAVVTFTAPADATGKVTFTLDEAESGVTKDIDNGQAVCEFENLTIGSHKVECVYTGDGNYNPGETKTAGFEVKSIDCPLTINYIYADGSEAYETYNGNVTIFNDYSVTSPEITGYAPDTATVEGAMGDDDMGGKTVTVTYTPVEFTATFVDENGETIAEIPYTVETEKLEAPAVPEKQGYAGEWEEYELTPGGITVKPVYTPADICPLDNEYHGDNFWGRLVKFFHTVIWKAFNLVGINIYLKIW